MDLTVARIGRAHGLRGEVSVELRTDIPEERLAVGSVLATEPADAGPLTVARTREQAGRWYVFFAEISDRSAAEGLRDVLLTVEADESDDEGAWFLHELVGLAVEKADGTAVGTVTAVEHPPAHDLLVIKETSGATSRVPFVEAMVPEVDVEAGRIVIDPPFGLLSGEEV